MTNRFRTMALVAGLLLPAAASAQVAPKAFGMSSRIVSVGLLAGGDYEGLGIGGAFEVGVYDFTPTLSLGLGGFAGFVRDSEGSVSLTQVPIMAIGNVHLSLPEQPKLDLYGGLSLGIVSASVKYDGAVPAGVDDSASDSEVGVGIQVGARYAFTPRVTAFGQLGGIDIPLLFAGLTFKF